MKIYKNNVLVLEIDNYGVLKKEFYNKEDMKILKLLSQRQKLKRNSFIYDFMSV